MVLVELREREPHGRIVRVPEHRLEVDDGAIPLAASLLGQRALAERLGASAKGQGQLGGARRVVGAPGTSQGLRRAYEIGGAERREGAAVQPHERGERDDVPGVVIDDLDERSVVAHAKVVSVACRDLGSRHVPVALVAEHPVLDGAERAPREPCAMDPPRDVDQIEVR